MISVTCILFVIIILILYVKHKKIKIRNRSCSTAQRTQKGRQRDLQDLMQYNKWMKMGVQVAKYGT